MKKTLLFSGIIMLFLLIVGVRHFPVTGNTFPDIIAHGETLQKCADRFKFSEGPVSDQEGNLYFSDYGNNRIHIWSSDGKLSVFKENVGGPIGLYFDKKGNLYCCAARDHCIKVISRDGGMNAYSKRFMGKLFNSPNDIWIDPKGGIYFTDPRFSRLPEKMEQDGMHVYYILPGSQKIISAANDLSGPNGIIGTPDGKLVYITDTTEDKTFVYTVSADGTLSGKKLFAPEGYDGLAIDSEGNVYITMTKSVEVYNPKGEKIVSIPVPDKPTNVCFGGKDRKTLFITARVSLYSLHMRIKGL